MRTAVLPITTLGAANMAIIGKDKCPNCGLRECVNAPRPQYEQAYLINAILRAEDYIDFPTDTEMLDYAATNGGDASTRQARLLTLKRAITSYRFAIKEA